MSTHRMLTLLALLFWLVPGLERAPSAASFVPPCLDNDMDGYADCSVPGCDPSGLACGDCEDTITGSEACDHVDNTADGRVDERFPWVAHQVKVESGSTGRMGRSVAGLGDVTGDGVPDFAAAADAEQKVKVFSGANRAVHCQYTCLASGCATFGKAMAGIGDVRGPGSQPDGIPDLAVGAPAAINSRGNVRVLSGADCSPAITLTDPESGVGDQLGSSVAGLEDIDGDTIPEIVAGAPLDDGAGSVVVFSGASGQRLCKLIDPNGETQDGLGAAVADVGDLDGDGAADIAAGVPGDYNNGNTGAGKVVVFSGADCANGNSEVLLELIGDPPDGPRNERLGTAVAKLGDVNCDGRPDIAAGAPGASDHSVGRVVLFSGSDGSVIRALLDPNLAGRTLGYSVAGMGDINGDGKSEIVAGAYRDHTTGPGKVLVFSGGDGLVLATLTDPTGPLQEQLGTSVAVVGDLSRGGVTEIAAGAPLFGGGVVLFAPFETDCDGDGYAPLLDCDDASAATHPGAEEVKDCVDNQCPGEPGHGLIDEITGMTGFRGKTEFFWAEQAGATQYEAVRSGTPLFSASCVRCATGDASCACPSDPRCFKDTQAPPTGAAFFYVVRSQAEQCAGPGSWGYKRVLGVVSERTGICP